VGGQENACEKVNLIKSTCAGPFLAGQFSILWGALGPRGPARAAFFWPYRLFFWPFSWAQRANGWAAAASPAAGQPAVFFRPLFSRGPLACARPISFPLLLFFPFFRKAWGCFGPPARLIRDFISTKLEFCRGFEGPQTLYKMNLIF